jgi:hypothetical protein
MQNGFIERSDRSYRKAVLRMLCFKASLIGSTGTTSAVEGVK